MTKARDSSGPFFFVPQPRQIRAINASGISELAFSSPQRLTISVAIGGIAGPVLDITNLANLIRFLTSSDAL
jgi:hypothetical protein